MPEPASLLRVATRTAILLLENGQTTERSIEAAGRVARLSGPDALVSVRWGEVTTGPLAAGQPAHTAFATPLGVDMRKVAATMAVVDRLEAGRIDSPAAEAALGTIARLPPIPILRFAVFAAAGAVALAVIFGTLQPATLLLIAASAGLGAMLRRWLSTKSRNPFVQPLAAATLAGLFAAAAIRLSLVEHAGLVALCPCMVLVPGPHLLNGALDLARTRITLAIGRIVYAGTIILMICAGLIFGLAAGGADLPDATPAADIAMPTDVLAAGIVIAAYGTFFSMPWRMLPLPILVGMAAHALRWTLTVLCGAGVEMGAFAACLLVGIVMTPAANRLHLPFAGCAFAAVVSMIPGVFLFRMAAASVALVRMGCHAPAGLLASAATDGTTALLILVAMAFGLIVPKLVLEPTR